MPRRKAPSKEESQLLPPYPGLAPAQIHVPATEAEWAQARQALLSATVLGFDTESKPVFNSTQTDTGPHVVQLATPDEAWILQLSQPPALALACEVLSHPAILKVGFGLDNDRATLPRRLGCALENVLDLDRVFSRHGFGRNTGVRAAIALVLGQSFHKSKKITTSNWAQSQLTESQVRYAAHDAQAPARLYAALPAWEAAQPPLTPQRAPRPRRPRPARPPAPAA